jgi:hypothetical protein
MAHSSVVASFGSGSQSIQILRVNPNGGGQ